MTMAAVWGWACGEVVEEGHPACLVMSTMMMVVSNVLGWPRDDDYPVLRAAQQH